MPLRTRDSVDHNIDDSGEEVLADRLAGEQQPEMDRADHRLDHLPGVGIGSDLTTLDRLLDDGTVEGKALVPEAMIRCSEPAVVWHLRHRGASSGGRAGAPPPAAPTLTP